MKLVIGFEHSFKRIFIPFFTQVDKLEESEAARVEEKKEEEYKPVVMGKFRLIFFISPFIMIHAWLCGRVSKLLH